MRQEISYAASADGVSLAYAVHGAGPGTAIVSLRPPQFSHVEKEWQAGASHHEFERYAEGRPVLRYDPRGTGLSTRDCQDFSLEAQVGDLEVVLEAAAVERLVLDAISSSALTAFAFALRHPQRIERLIVQNAFADGEQWWSNPVRRALVNIAAVDWPLCTETWAWLTWGDERRQRTLRLAAYIRECLDAPAFTAMVAAERRVNLPKDLTRITVPTLVLNHPRFARMAPESHNAQVALAIPGAQLHSIASADDRVAAIRAFVAGRPLPRPQTAPAPIPAGGRLPALSARELEVLQLMADGHTNREIAERLVVSVRTVDAHVRNIFDKTDSHSRAGAAAYAIRNQLL